MPEWITVEERYATGKVRVCRGDDQDDLRVLR